MDKKTTGWVAYLTWIGLIVAFCAGDKEGAKFHLNQALVIMIITTVGFIFGGILLLVPVLGFLVFSLWGMFCFVMWLLGLVAAINEEEKEVPLLGKIKILK